MIPKYEINTKEVRLLLRTLPGVWCRWGIVFITSIVVVGLLFMYRIEYTDSVSVRFVRINGVVGKDDTKIISLLLLSDSIHLNGVEKGQKITLEFEDYVNKLPCMIKGEIVEMEKDSIGLVATIKNTSLLRQNKIPYTLIAGSGQIEMKKRSILAKIFESLLREII